MNKNIVFMGTPDFAVPSLQALIENDYNILAVVTQSDKKAGRGHKLIKPPVKVLAEQHNIPVYQPEKISSQAGVDILKELSPDVLITAAFGQILSEEVLAIATHGCINVHASLLPKYRGSAPIQWAIINGEQKTGITTMYTVRALDAGDILEQDELLISKNMTAGELYKDLSELGAKTLLRTLQKLEENTLTRVAQKEEESTYFPMFKKGFGEVDFSKTCDEIINFVRGTNPHPGAFITYNEEKIKINSVSSTDETSDKKCGQIVFADNKKGLLIKAADGVISVDELKRSGSKAMSAKASLCGKTLDSNYCFFAGEENN